ncbi:glycosyl hydrolase [Rhodovulum sp. ES.010]|uniref:glycosyl hydrolase n=1 Tax=Rhodovulum sp. ES.010 TaxID=1882821 RepID=UPI0020C9823D|nr:glycosyl hydrolase [Rhodovulum sp. ES.010]
MVGVFLLSNPALAQKAGVGAWENPRYTMIRWIEETPGLGWYYNWRTDQIWSRQRHRRDVEFVPMIHSAKDVNAPIRSDRRVSALLGFNEPDGYGGPHQAGMSVAEAIALWPRLEARGLRLGSPSTSTHETLGPNSWQGRFMAEVERRGLRVDFMAVHYYTTDGDVDAFRRWLTQVHREYRRPIWVTEFAFIDWSRPGRASYDRNAAFAASAMAMMERLPFVERYAWFAANPYPWKGRTPKINLVDDNLRPTPVGRTYEQVMARMAGVQVASAE